MNYRKFKADRIFTGREFLSGNFVLMATSNGEIVGLEEFDDSTDNIERYKGTLCPGFVNAHCHLELSHLKDVIPPHTGLIPFLLDVVGKRDFPMDVILDRIEKAEEEDIVEENLAARLVADFGLFDPTLELSNYKFPTIDLLKEYSSGGITINQEELEENKNKIVDTLRNYKIEIAQIKATVGPSVTLYEIVPEAGIRISKIKSLEDDIALSLSALGIRIIAPIPGKGTIGIEVPNKNPTMVSMKSAIGSAKFQEAEMELPIALGETISNETFVVDLAKMPHCLIAGATGQLRQRRRGNHPRIFRVEGAGQGRDGPSPCTDLEGYGPDRLGRSYRSRH